MGSRVGLDAMWQCESRYQLYRHGIYLVVVHKRRGADCFVQFKKGARGMFLIIYVNYKMKFEPLRYCENYHEVLQNEKVLIGMAVLRFTE